LVIKGTPIFLIWALTIGYKRDIHRTKILSKNFVIFVSVCRLVRSFLRATVSKIPLWEKAFLSKKDILISTLKIII